MTPNSRIIEQRRRSNSASTSYYDLSENQQDHHIKRGFISRLLPNTKVNAELPLSSEYKSSFTNKSGNSFGSLFKRKGGTKAHPDMEDVPKVRPIRHPQNHSKIPLAPPPPRRRNSLHSHFLTDLPDQYITKRPVLTSKSSDSIYSTFGTTTESSDEEFVDADEFSQEDIERLEKRLEGDKLAKRLSGGHFGSAGGLVACIQPDRLKIPQDDELGQSMINWKRHSNSSKRWSHLLDEKKQRHQSVITVIDLTETEEGQEEQDREALRRKAEQTLDGNKQERLFSSDVWTNSSCHISLDTLELKEQSEEKKEDEEQEEEKAKTIAHQLWKEDESITSREKMAEWLGQVNSFHSFVLGHYMQYFNFSDMRLEAAFRKLCSKLYFKAEAQQIDRILEAFANRYWECNTTCLLGSADVVYAVIYSLLLLNTDLHVAQGKHVRMTRSEFVRNTMSTVLEQKNDSRTWQSEVENYLKEMYTSVKQFQILQPLTRKSSLAKRGSIMGNRRVVGLKRGMNSIIRKSGIIDTMSEESLAPPRPSISSSHNTSIRRESFSSTNSSGTCISSRCESPSQSAMLQFANTQSSLLDEAPYHKQGIVIRKHLLENSTQKARHREWRECYLEVKNGELRMSTMQEQTDKSLFRQSSVGHLLENDPNIGKILLNHTLSNSLPPPGYNRQRPHVFAIQQSDGGVYLFQVTSAKETQDWVSACNYWAARTSKEPLSGGVSNMEYGWGNCLESQEPVTIHEWMPPTASMISSQFSEREQYQILSRYLDELNNEINQHRDKKAEILNNFSAKCNTQVNINWEARAKYLLHEIIKYQNYCDSLEKSIERTEKALEEEDKKVDQTMQVDLFKEINQELHFNL